MTDKYKILKADEKSGNELTITFQVKPDKSPPFESSINVPHNVSEEIILKRINDAAYNLIEYRVKKKKEKEDKDKVNKEKAKNARDKLKKDIDKHKDVVIDIVKPEKEKGMKKL